MNTIVVSDPMSRDEAPEINRDGTSVAVLALASPQATLATVGGKGASLARLVAAGLPVPDGFHVTTAAYRQFVTANNLWDRIRTALQSATDTPAGNTAATATAIGELFAAGTMPPAVAAAIRQAYAALPGLNPAVAVRSSATAEDLPGASFAGQQETYLNVSGAEAVLAAVQKCWASLWTARAISYRNRAGIAPEGVALAVVVQLLIPAEAAGNMFTADPVTGRRARVVINAAWGLGESVVGGSVTPDILVVDKATGKVCDRRTADKQVMTARTKDGTVVTPVPQGLRNASVLSDAAAAELTRFGQRIEQLNGTPMDIEWARADGRFAIVQARPITALPAPPLDEREPVEAPTPTEWALPEGCYAAMRNNIVELMGEPLSPLFATLGRAAINASLHRVMEISFDIKGIMPPEIVIVVNQYAYNNGSLSLGGLVRLLTGAIGILRRMFTGAVERWTQTGRPRYFEAVARWQDRDCRNLSAVELVGGARALAEAAFDAYGALISGAIPAAWMTEAAFTAVYDRLIKRRGEPASPTFLLGYDSLPIRADKALQGLAAWVARAPALRDYLDRTPTPSLAVRVEPAPAEVSLPTWEAWQQRFQAHLREYGHMLYDLDFAHPVPADDPTPVLDALKLHLRGQGVDPDTRQRGSAERREQAIQAIDQRLSGWRRKLFHRVLAAAQKYAPLREDGLAEIGLAYPLLRRMLRELGQRFARHGVIAIADDVFWLTDEEVVRTATLLDAGRPVEPCVDRIPARQAERRAALRVSPPRALPQMKVFGFDLMSLKARRGRGGQAGVIRGVAASPGQVTAVARVLHGPEDFDQLQPGDVLVAAITTPAWTPLFARASAIVTDIGGPLSHGSIVAREYGLPAVLGADVATRRIRSGDVIHVDGTLGVVTLPEHEARP